MRKMMQRSLSCLLTLAMVVTMLMTSTLAAEKSAKLEFDYSANYESSKVVSLEVYKGYPADSYAKEEEIFSQLEAITPQADGSYVVTAPGTYAYHVHGTGYYNILQLFNVTEADLTAGVKKLSVIGGKLGGNGFEPTIKPEKARGDQQALRPRAAELHHPRLRRQARRQRVHLSGRADGFPQEDGRRFRHHASLLCRYDPELQV